MDLSVATGAVETIDLAGEEHPCRLLTFREWGAITAWLKRANPSPVTRAAHAIEQAREAGEPFSRATADELMDHAQRAALNWPPRLASNEWFEAFDRTDGGQSYLLHAVLSKADPAYTLERADILVKRMHTDPDWNELLRVALYGNPPRPKAESGTTPPAPPPSPTTGPL